MPPPWTISKRWTIARHRTWLACALVDERSGAMARRRRHDRHVRARDHDHMARGRARRNRERGDDRSSPRHGEGEVKGGYSLAISPVVRSIVYWLLPSIVSVVGTPLEP